jgi:hypothetical protein
MPSSRSLRDVFAAAIFLGCLGGSRQPPPPSPDGGEAVVPPVVLRAGVAEWLRGDANDPAVGIIDGEADGQRVALLGFVHQTQPVLLLSDDQGASFSRRDLPRAADKGVEGTRQDALGTYLVHLYQGRIPLLVGGSFVATQSAAVTWSVLETGGGSVDSSGHYTAPGIAGTYHVVATNVADTSKSDAATVTVYTTTLIAPDRMTT